MEFFAQLFSHVCGQVHLCFVNREALPLCERCMGLYFGGSYALLLSVFRPRPTGLMLWLHGLFMLVMLPFGFHMVQHGTVFRLITGQLFAYGLTYYLLLLPAENLPDEATSVRSQRRATFAYFTAAVAGIALLLILTARGGHSTAVFLVLAATIGLVSYALLVVWNLITIGALVAHSFPYRKRPQNS